jgi:Domain of unknown function (DUF4260)
MSCSDWRHSLHSLPDALPISASIRIIGVCLPCCFWCPTSLFVNKASAAFYNLVHSYVLPLGLGLVAWDRGSVLGVQLALIWVSHISFDRCLGYGLKFPESFRYTHIQRSAAFADTPLPGKI